MKHPSLITLVLAACATSAIAAPAHEPHAVHGADIAEHATTVVRSDLAPGQSRPVHPLTSAQVEVRLPTAIHAGMIEPVDQAGRAAGAQ